MLTSCWRLSSGTRIVAAFEEVSSCGAGRGVGATGGHGVPFLLFPLFPGAAAGF